MHMLVLVCSCVVGAEAQVCSCVHTLPGYMRVYVWYCGIYAYVCVGVRIRTQLALRRRQAKGGEQHMHPNSLHNCAHSAPTHRLCTCVALRISMFRKVCAWWLKPAAIWTP